MWVVKSTGVRGRGGAKDVMCVDFTMPGCETKNKKRRCIRVGWGWKELVEDRRPGDIQGNVFRQPLLEGCVGLQPWRGRGAGAS